MTLNRENSDVNGKPVRGNRVKSGMTGFNAIPYSLKRGLVTAILVVSVLVMFTASASATEHHVGPGQTYPTIQDAENASVPYDTIIVHDGTYTENVDVDVSHLTIQSQNGDDSTTVQAADSSGSVFFVIANYVNISGFEVTGSTGMAGIYLVMSDHCNIHDNNASSNKIGIYLWCSSNNMLTSNTANLNTQHGIYLCGGWGECRYNTLTSNTANLNTQHGIWLQSSSSNTLTNNAFTNPGATNAEDDAATAGLNAWNDATTGNYYSDYGGSGTYPISGGSSIDYRPLSSVPPVPELATIVLFSVGLLMLAGYVRVGRRK